MCGGCSKNSYLIVNISSKPVRVCDACHATLVSKNQSSNAEESSDSDSETKDKDEHNETGKSIEELNIDEKVSGLRIFIHSNVLSISLAHLLPADLNVLSEFGSQPEQLTNATLSS